MWSRCLQSGLESTKPSPRRGTELDRVGREVEALLLPAVMRYNAPVTAARLEVVAQVMAPSATGAGIGAGAGLGDRAAAIVESFLRRLGVPSRLRDAGVDRQAIPQIVAHTLDDWVITQIPRPISREGLHALLAAAW